MGQALFTFDSREGEGKEEQKICLYSHSHIVHRTNKSCLRLKGFIRIHSVHSYLPYRPLLTSPASIKLVREDTAPASRPDRTTVFILIVQIMLRC